MLLYTEPNLFTSDRTTAMVVQSFTSGVSFLNCSGITAEVAVYNTADYLFSNPITRIPVPTDQNGIGTPTIGGVQFSSSGPLTIRARYGTTYSTPYNIEISALASAAQFLDSLLCAFRDIPRYEEPGMLSEDGLTARFGWDKWHVSPAPVILKNTSEWQTQDFLSGQGYAIDYDKGLVYFQSPLSPGEDVRANYSFRLLGLGHYRNFLNLALGLVNGKKPMTFYTWDNVPAPYLSLILLEAYYQACKALIPKMQMFRWRRLFEDPDRLASELRANADGARAEFDTLLPAIKRRGEVLPRGVGQFNQNMPFAVDETSFKAFSVIR